MKHAAEQYATSSGVPTTIVRASAFMELWVDLFRQTAARSGRPLVFGRGDNPVNFVSVADVAAIIDKVVAEPGSRGQTLEIGGPANLSFNQLAAAVQNGMVELARPAMCRPRCCGSRPTPSAGSSRSLPDRPAPLWRWTAPISPSTPPPSAISTRAFPTPR